MKKNSLLIKDLIVVLKQFIVGPCNDREGATKLGNNQSITQEEAEAFEALAKAGYTIKFALLPDCFNWNMG